MTLDAQGNTVSGATPGSAERLDQAILAFTIGHGDALVLLDAVAALAPEMPMALIAKAWILALPLDPKLAVIARGLADRARNLRMNDRERALLGALDLALSSQRRASVAALDAHLIDHPRDILAHYICLFLDTLLGRAPLVCDRVKRAMPFWSDETSGFAVLRTINAFGMEEASRYDLAEDEARAAIELEPHLYFAHHTVAHCMEMTGRPEAGVAFSKEREPFWATAQSPAQGHIWWHTAMFHLELDDFDDALKLYDGPLLRTIRPVGFSLSDPVALLWRLDMLGCDVSRRWQELLPRWDGHADGRGMVFTDMHASITELRSGNEALAEARLAAMHRTAAGEGEAAMIYREVGVPLVEGLIAYHRGDYAACIEQLFPTRAEVWRIGGSRAQRDIVDWTLTTAALRAGRKSLAMGLTYERLAGRPESLINLRFKREAEQITH